MSIVCITPVKHLDGVYELLEQYDNVFYEPDITKNELKKLLITHEIEYLFTNPNKQSFILDRELLEHSSLKVINTCSTGLNHIDIDYCERNDIEVWSLKTDFELINDLPSTAELSFGLMMSLLRKIPEGFDSVKKGEWDYEPFIGRQVKGLTIGIIGYGRLGRITAELLKGWGVKILVNDPYVDVDNENCIRTTMHEVWKQSDVIFLHLHVTDTTRELVSGYFISNMKKGSILINTSRGELVNEKDIINSIKEGHLGGYGTDVITDEFGDVKESELVEFSRENDNVVITPHVGGMTWEGQTKAYKWAIDKFGGINER
jgi:D-3-phosphoglycerate dehydrogenase / 2-oxoglutarate reductase